MAWMEAEMEMYFASAVRKTLRGEVVLERLPVRGGDFAGDLEHGGLGAEDGDHGVQEWEVDDLAGVAGFDFAAGDHDGEGAVEAGDHVGEGEGGEDGFSVGEAVHGGETAHAFDEGAEAWAFAVGAVLAEAGDSYDDEFGVLGVQGFGG